MRFLSALLLAALYLISPCLHAQQAGDSNSRMAWWREARYGMFIHWSLFAVPAGTWKGQRAPGLGEWIMHDLKIPVADYRAQVSQFNPTQFDADKWVSIAKAAGMKYIVITAKHHDGFAMFESKADPFNIVDATPYHHDPMKDLAVACQKYGLKLGFYYSQDQDWSAPGGAALFGGHWDKAQDGDFGHYIDTKVVPQLQELLTDYQPFPALIWFDTPTAEMTPVQADKIRAVMKQHPDVLYNNRLGAGDSGDWDTPEGYIPPVGPGRDWETCMNINSTWGYESFDVSFKSVDTLTRNLIDIASKGGNYLLNVGPTPEGVIPQPEVDRVLAVGKWLSVNGEAIYGTQANPFRRAFTWGRCTRKGDTLYFSVFDWPASKELRIPVSNQPVRAWLLSDPKTDLAARSASDGIHISLPATAPDSVASVVALALAGPANIIDQDLKQASDHSLVLTAPDADIKGRPLEVDQLGSDANLGQWTDPTNYAQWPVTFDKPGTFTVTFNYALDAKSVGSGVTLAVGDQTLNFSPASTGDWRTFTSRAVGKITVTQPGHVVITLKANKKPVEGVINLRSITFTPSSS